MLWRWNKHILDRAKEKAFPAQRMKQGERRSGKEGGLSPPQKSGGNLLRLPLRLLIGQLFLVGEPGHVDVEYGIDQGYARREEHEETVRGIIREPNTQHPHGEQRVRAPRDEGRRKRPDILRNAGAIFGPITLPTEQRSHDRPCHEQAEVRRRRQQNRAETDNNR